jgi:hypothetical protein
MELDDLKNTWKGIDTQGGQQRLTAEGIEKIIQDKYGAKIKRITYPEIIGIMICVLGAVFIGINYTKLTSTFSQLTGVVAIFLLLIISLLSLVSLRKLIITKDVSLPCIETLKTFALQKLQFYKLQKMNVILSYFLLVTIIMLLPQMFHEDGVSSNKYFWIFSFSLGYIFLLFLIKWVSRSYKKTLDQVEELLSELHAK